VALSVAAFLRDGDKRDTAECTEEVCIGPICSLIRPAQVCDHTRNPSDPFHGGGHLVVVEREEDCGVSGSRLFACLPSNYG
jgi:hypothetical protein